MLKIVIQMLLLEVLFQNLSLKVRGSIAAE